MSKAKLAIAPIPPFKPKPDPKSFLAPVPQFRPKPKPTFVYVRREQHWRTTAARFNAIFDAIPTNAAGACRENPKRYRIRRHGTLVEFGLMEHELAEPPDTPEGLEIMKKLDRMEEKLERQRWEAMMQASQIVEVKTMPKKTVKAVPGAHCVDNARACPPVKRSVYQPRPIRR